MKKGKKLLGKGGTVGRDSAPVIPSAHSIPNSQYGGTGTGAGAVPAGSKQQLIEKNLKLKQELRVLAGELDNILAREKQKREQRYSHSTEDNELKGTTRFHFNQTYS